MKLLPFIWLFLLPIYLMGQTANDSIYVEEVRILGHKKTRSSTIFREMPFGRTESMAIKDIEAKISEAEANLLNTGLFAEVNISTVEWNVPGNKVVFVVTVRENWYIYPVPVFELADRNFNVWWTEQNRALDRVNLGVKFTHYNFTGRRDRLRLGIEFGYTEQLGLSYNLPYLNRQQNLGLILNFSTLRRREQNFQTTNDRQEFYEDPDNFVYNKSEYEVGLVYRRRLYASHTVRLGYRNESIADTIAQELNPNFFSNQANRQRYFSLYYEFTDDRRDVRGYAWKGSYFRARLQKDGLGILGERNSFAIWGDYRRFTPLGEKWSLNTSVGFKYSLARNQQPFLENRAVGFGDYGMAGYQFFVVDGLDMVIFRAGLRRKLFKGRLDLGKLVFIDAFRYIPYRVLFGAQIDQGWTNAPFNEGRNALANKWLLGASAGLDVVLFYDIVLSVRYHRNRLGQGSILFGTDINL
ncbi:MAG: POTRA domain-containing protein [Bacteroidota bacterium]